MTWEEWLFLEASKETGGQFQMHRLSPVKELYQDILALSPTQAFPCSSPTAGAATFRQVWRTWGWGSKVRNRLALQQEKKKILVEYEVPLSHWLLCLPLSTPFFRKVEDTRRETEENTLEVSYFETAKMPIRHIFWEPEAVSSCCLATCSSSSLFSSVAYVSPAWEEFRLGFKCFSPTCASTCYFMGHGKMCERGSIITNFTAVEIS